MRPKRSRISLTLRATVSTSVRSPCTATTSVPCVAAISVATASSDSASPSCRVDVGVVPWTATFAPRLARCSATTRPIPREEPVTQAHPVLQTLHRYLLNTAFLSAGDRPGNAPGLRGRDSESTSLKVRGRRVTLRYSRSRQHCANARSRRLAEVRRGSRWTGRKGIRPGRWQPTSGSAYSRRGRCSHLRSAAFPD